MSFLKPRTACALAALAVSQAMAQTRIDLRTQTKSVDFSAASSTKPSQTGTNLPVTCAVGQTFLNTSAQPGQNLYVCTTANVWTAQGGAGVANYSTTFTGATSVSVPGTTHKLGTASLIVQVYDNQSPAWLVEPDDVLINPATYDVLVKFATPQSGTVILSAVGSSGSGSAGANGAGMAAQLGDFQVTRASGTALSIGANCSASTPCNVRVGSVVYSYTQGATVTLTGGTGLAYVYVDFAGNLTVGHNLTLSCSTGCVATPGVTAFPVNTVPIFTWSATSGSWDPSGTDRRAFLSAKALVAGAGIVTIDAGAQTQVAVDSATVPTFLTATTTLAFANISAQGCAELTFALPGAATADAVEPGWPSGLEAGLIGTMRVSAVGTIAVRLCNLSGAGITPASAAYRATIVRSF